MPYSAKCSFDGDTTNSDTDTSITSTASIRCRSENWMTVPKRVTVNSLAASSSSTSQWPTSQWQTSGSPWQPTSAEKWWWFRFLGKNSRNWRGVWTRHPLTIQFVRKRGNAHKPNHDLQCDLCASEKNLSSDFAHVTSVFDSPAVHHEHFIYLIHSPSYHDTRTRSTIGTTWSTPRTHSTSRTSPSSLSRQAAPSRITLTWKPAEWRKNRARQLSQKTQRAMMKKLKMTFGRQQEKSFIVIRLNPESNCTCREKNHFLFRWSTSTLPATTHTSFDVLLEKNIED